MGQRSVIPTRLGEHLGELLVQRGATAGELAQALGLSAERLGELVGGEQILTADVALLLGAFFDVPVLDLLETQSRYLIEIRDREEVSRVLAA